MNMSLQVIDIPTEKIIPDPDNLRQTFDENDIKSLADNILEHGQLDPVQVFETGNGTFDLFDGERRWRACKLANIPFMRAIIIAKPNDSDLLVKKISRTMQTRNLSFPEQIRALEQGLCALDVREQPDKWASAARKLGVPPSVLRERMRVTQLTTKLRKAFEQGELDYTIAQTIGRIEDPRRQEEAARFISDNNLSNRFVMTKFIQALLEFPNEPLLQVYDIAKHRERYRYQPRNEEIPADLIDRLDDMLADLRRAEKWLEAAAREDLLSQLVSSPFNAQRFWAQLRRLHGFLLAFNRRNPAYSSSAQTVFEGSADPDLLLLPETREHDFAEVREDH